MPLNILRPAAGCPDIETLATRQQMYAMDYNGRTLPVIHTRNTPKRTDEIKPGTTDAGSVYWIIKHKIRVRQSIHAIERVVNDEGRSACLIWLEPEHVCTALQPCKPFQGWRYLEGADAPADLAAFPDVDVEGEAMPEPLVEELRSLGLL